MHEISAIVAGARDAERLSATLDCRPKQARHGWWLVPLAGLKVPDLEEPGADAHLRHALAPLATRLGDLGLSRPVALVFTQYFGGDGEQAAAVLEGSTFLLGPVVGPDAINQALAHLGVEAEAGRHDLFETVGLEQWRSMDALAAE